MCIYILLSPTVDLHSLFVLPSASVSTVTVLMTPNE